MKRFLSQKAYLVCLLVMSVFISILAGCGGGGGGSWTAPSAAIPPVTPALVPKVTIVSPVNGATGVFIDAPVRATFSEAMDPASITTTSFTVKASGPPLGPAIGGTVSYNPATRTATFKPPVSNFATDTLYTATITTVAKNPAGKTLANDFVWTFRTGLTTNNLPPTVTNIFPADAATGVFITTKTITAEFSKNMDPTTINSTTFTVQESGPPLGLPIAGTISYDGLTNTATFAPTADLTPETLYTVTVTNGGTDESICPLATVVPGPAGLPKNPWTFRTAAPIAHLGPAPVPLASAGTFRILAGSALTNLDIVGNRTSVNGDVGVSPGSTVNGFTAVDNIVPPFNLYAGVPIAATAKINLTAAYNDSQSRSTAAISLPGQLGGLTFAPGLYVNSSTSGISGTGPNAILTLDGQGDPTAVWIFKMGSTLITDPGTSIVCINGCKAENIFWQVGSSATLGVGSVFYGTILADIAITMNTNAVLHGRALTRTAAVSLDTNLIVP